VSLFEQAIARLRSQPGTSGNEGKPSTGSRKPVSTVAARPMEEAPEPVKRITLDLDGLRERGYLPEEAVSRAFSEHYRRIKRPLVDKAVAGAAGTGESRVIMVTSALPGDGKTFTSINLALSMALERDISVLLVDCDVAKRHVSEITGLRDDRGLVDALIDDSADVESLVVGTNQRGLSHLPAGTRAQGTAELLSSNRMREIVASLCLRAPRRIVLLDSPPLLITNEGRALAKLAGQVALVVRAGHTPRQAVMDAIGLFDAAQAGGIILNHVSIGRSDGYYGYYGYGSYGTGSDAT
jgi:exopolysaccharide/PEP-CTERM locus tyrosine autokinase